MANCLYECLREAKLEQYYQNFEANGITRSEGLTSLTMQEYSNYGIDDMYDRKRLFQLIQIIKSVQNNGKKCRRNCESCQDEGTPRLSNRSSPESESSVDDLHQAYTTSANQNDSLNNSVITRKYIKTNNNNVMSSRMPDKVDNKPEIVFVETQGPSLQKSRSQTRRHTLRRSLSDSETMEPNQDNHRPKLRDRTAEVINYAGLEYNYGVPSAAPRTAPAASSYATHVNLLNTSAMPVDRIQVCVRKRPMNKKEKRNKEADVIDVEHPRKIVLNEQKTSVDLTRFIQQHEFYFDEVFDENQSNEQIYERTAKPLVNSVFKGGKATCFAYGQTGAGKTHTMLGNDKVQGLYLLAAKDIFSILHSGYHGRNLSVWISYFEIYCGQLFDLLNGRKRLHAREDGKNNVCIAGIKEFQIGNVAALMEAIEFGNQVRSTGSSGVNADSSRSHAILQVQLKENSKRKVGRFSFIDLAGSERAADTNDPDRITRIEGAEINTSLLALKECIRAIDQEQRHTPFRQSKLTHILKESFLGNSRTCMIANISPNSNASEHTLNTLRYANRVKELKKDSVSSSSGSPNSATHLPRAPSIFSPSNTSTPKRKPKPSPLSRESTSWEVSQIRGCNYKPYSVPKLRASRDSRKTNRKYSSPEEDNRNLHIHNTVGSPRGIHNSVGSPRSIYNGVGSPRGNIGSSRISIERGEVRVVGGDSGDIKVVKYSPSKPSSDYFSTPVSTRNFSETNWEFDNPRFVSSPRRSGTTAQTSPGSPAKSEASVRLSVDNLKSDGALRKSKEFWVVRNDSSSVRNLLMDSSPEEADEGEISETDSDSTSTDNTSEIIKELDRILDQSWIKSGSSGDNSYQQAEHPDELQIDPLTDQRIFQTDQSITLRPQEDSDNMAATSTRPVCDLRAPEKPDVEENGVHEVNGYSLRETAAANMNGYHSNDVGKVKVSKKSRKRWVADATIGNSMAREIEGLPSPRDFLKSLSQTKSAEKQKQGTPSKKTSPSGVIVPTDFQECFMPTQLKYTPEPDSETVAGTQTSVSTSPVADIPVLLILSVPLQNTFHLEYIMTCQSLMKIPQYLLPVTRTGSWRMPLLTDQLKFLPLSQL
ncbi:kinesin-like protein KIF24 [Ptychodera flava]|uniref:kinesin-like protein KIF24 n=1 Tax=Ptychodera flava TaxID=63121 RepID=UPI00396A3698